MSTAATTPQPTTSSNVTKLPKTFKETVTNAASHIGSDELAKSNKDDDTCDDWEQLDQIQIKKSLQSIKLSSEKNDDESNLINATTTNTSNLPIPFTFTMQNANSSFPQPSIKILKRPPSDKKLNEMASQNPNNTAQPIKTFKQREQEYAEARLRILGSAHPEDEDPNINSAAAAGSISSNNSNNSNSINNNSNNINLINSNTTVNSNKSVHKPSISNPTKVYGANSQPIFNNSNSNNNSGYYQPSFANNNNMNNNMQNINSYLSNPSFENSNYPNQRNFSNNNTNNSINSFPINSQNINNTKQTINLIREPIVPDGTRGFRGGFENEHGRNFSSSSNAKQ